MHPLTIVILIIIANALGVIIGVSLADAIYRNRGSVECDKCLLMKKKREEIHGKPA